MNPVRIIAWSILLITLAIALRPQPSGFERRWQPVIEHPLLVKGGHWGFCHPIKCAVG